MSSPDEPLIWTTKGNIPIASLRYEHSWNITDDEISFVERYLQGDEEVKKNVHVLKTKGIFTISQVGGVG